MAGCGCHCIRCGGTALDSEQVGVVEQDGYYDMHHTCRSCGTHFDHLEGTVFKECGICRYSNGSTSALHGAKGD